MRLTRLVSIPMLLAAIFTILACGGDSEPEDRAFNLNVSDGILVMDANALSVKQGDTVTLSISSDDHGTFRLHGYDIQVSVGPGETAEIKLNAGATGSFPITFHPGEEGEDPSHEEDGEEGEEVSLGALQVFPR